MRKFLKKLDYGRAAKYKQALIDRIMAWECRLYKYKMDLVNNNTFPQHIIHYITMTTAYTCTIGIYGKCIDELKGDLKKAIQVYTLFRNTMETTLRNRSINYDDYIEGNKAYDFSNNPFVRIIASGERNTLWCYVTHSEKNVDGVLIRGILLDDTTFEASIEKKLLYNWCRILPMEDHHFREFLKCYRNHLLSKGNTVVKINEETDFMINEWRKNDENGNNK